MNYICKDTFYFSKEQFYDDLPMLGRYKQNAEFVEDIHWEAHNGEGEGIGCRCDDGGDDEYDDNGMATVLLHLLAVKNAEAAEKPRKNWYLENKAHGEREEDESVDVTLEGDEVLHAAIHLIVAEEAKCNGENDEVVEERACHEHDVGSHDKRHRVPPLVLIQCRRNETV